MFTRAALLAIHWRRYGDRIGCYRRKCVMCGVLFFAGRPQATYCRPACRQRAYRRRRRERYAM